MFGPIFWKIEHGDPLMLFLFLSACAINNRFRQKDILAHSVQSKTVPSHLKCDTLVHGVGKQIWRVNDRVWVRPRVYKNNSMQLHLMGRLSLQNFKCVIDDAQLISFQVVMHAPLNTCMLVHSRSLISGFLTGISRWACTLHARVRRSTVLNVEHNARWYK